MLYSWARPAGDGASGRFLQYHKAACRAGVGSVPARIGCGKTIVSFICWKCTMVSKTMPLTARACQLTVRVQLTQPAPASAPVTRVRISGICLFFSCRDMTRRGLVDPRTKGGLQPAVPGTLVRT